MKLSAQTVLFALCLVIASIGLVAIYDASIIEGFRTFSDKYHFVKQQGIWLCLGFLIFFVSSSIPLKHYRKFSTLIFFVSLIFMLLVLIPGIGSKVQGARRWISLGPIGFQPSEFFKTSLVLYLSTWLEKPKPLPRFLLVMTVSLGLIMLQPDMGTGVVITFTSFAMFYLSGADLKSMFSFFSILTLGLAVLILSSSYRMDRLKTYLDPTSDQLGSSYHINQVLLGLGSGGWSGVGLGQSRQKYAFLPEATTDSIFVIFGEELGFVGSVLLVSLLAILTFYILNLGLNITAKQPMLLVVGVGLLLLSQIFVNLGSMVALIPLTGVPLPLISYGGSSLANTFLALGLLNSALKDK